MQRHVESNIWIKRILRKPDFWISHFNLLLTMFIINTIAEEKWNGFVQIKVESEKYAYSHAIMLRSFPVMEYNPSEGLWYLPIMDIPALIKLLEPHRLSAAAHMRNNKFLSNIPQVHGILEDETKTNYELSRDISQIKISRQAYQSYLKFKHLSKKLEEIRSGERVTIFDDFMKTPLWDFQTIGGAFLYYAKEALLADQVGLGKTNQALAAVEYAFRQCEINLVVIVCPNSIKRNWVAEIEKFTTGHEVMVVGGAGKGQRIYAYKNASDYDFLVLNYDVLYRDFPLIEEHIMGNQNFRIAYIFDEAQYVKNRETKRARAAHILSHSQNAVMRLGLSATPIENEPADLFGVFGAISLQPFGPGSNFSRFKTRYCMYDYWGKFTGFRKADEIRARMDPFLIRRFKDEVAKEMPERVKSTLWVDLSPEQRKFYDECERKIVTQIKNMEKAAKIKQAEILPLLIYLRQCCLSTKLIGHEKNISTKLDLLIEYLTTVATKDKVVIFCYFTGMVDLIAEALDAAKIPNISMHGKKTKEADRQTGAQQFNESKDLRVLVTSDILREGINLPSASMLINFDLLWNPRKIEQRIGRIDRLTNKHPVLNIVSIVANKTIEEYMLETFNRKDAMNREILDAGKQENNLTFKDIKTMFDIK